MKNIAKLSALALSAVLISGCGVTPEQLQEVRTIAENALAEARAASGQAANALKVAGEANAAANQAAQSAQTALECCNANSAKIDKMFEKAMMK